MYMYTHIHTCTCTYVTKSNGFKQTVQFSVIVTGYCH